MIRPESKVIAQRWMRKVCVNRMCRKMRKYGKVLFQVKEVVKDDFTERAAVDEALREEQSKRGLR